MNVNEITFGIEIETTLPPTSTMNVGPHGHGFDIPQLAGWKADRDPSIRATGGRIACEFVSPVFKGPEGLAQLLIDLARIKNEFGAVTNASCGLHIHVGFNKADAEACARLVTLVSHFEKAIFASTGTKNRERGHWCGGVRRYNQPDQAIAASRRNRYHVANFGTAKPTVEFRAFSASLNPRKIVAYVRLCLGLVERAMTSDRATKWAPKPKTVVTTDANGVPISASIQPAGPSKEGRTAINKLFYGLGWTKGRLPRAFGALAADGVPDLESNKEILMEMAKKYDAQP